MKMIRIPSRLKIALAATLLCAPIAAVQTVLYLKAPWWKLPYREMALAGVVVSVALLPFLAAIAYGRRVAYAGCVALATVWILGSGWIAISRNSFWLGVVALALALFWVIHLYWILMELKRSYFQPAMDWYEGAPRPIPHLYCDVSSGGSPVRMRVSRLDRDGVFVFKSVGSGEETAFDEDAGEFDLNLSFGAASIRCKGSPVRVLGPKGAAAGLGMRFSGLTPDQRKELGDFVEGLRGKGYVQ